MPSWPSSFCSRAEAARGPEPFARGPGCSRGRGSGMIRWCNQRRLDGNFSVLMRVAAGGEPPVLVAGPRPRSRAGRRLREPAGFDKWLGDIRREATAQGSLAGLSPPRWRGGVSYDPGIISRDRGQRVFKQSFEEFSGRMVSRGRLTQGAAKLRQYAPTLARD